MLEIAGIGIFSAFLAGIVSFLSPCVLPLVPGYVSYIAGQSLDGLRERAAFQEKFHVMGQSVMFTLGFSTVFIALGASATALGVYLRTFMFEANYVAGGIIVLFGIFMMGIFRLPWLGRDTRRFLNIRGDSPVSAYLLGAAFAFGWTPCIGPILGAILTLSAATLTVSQGMALLFFYAAGLAVPFLLVAAFLDRFLRHAKPIRRAGSVLQVLAGGVLVVVGLAMSLGYLNYAGTWLLNTFPGFQGLII